MLRQAIIKSLFKDNAYAFLRFTELFPFFALKLKKEYVYNTSNFEVFLRDKMGY